MSTKKVTLNLTGIIIQDVDNRGYTAYFAEFPEAIADGTNQDDVKENLIDAFKIMLETRRLENYQENIEMGGIIQENFQFELA